MKIENNLQISKEETIRVFEELGIFKKNLCKNCNTLMSKIKKNDRTDGFIMRCKKCKISKSIRTDTFLENTKIPLIIFSKILYFFILKHDIQKISNLLNISKKTLIKYFDFFRLAMGRFMEENFKKLGGKDEIVQIDETVVAKRKNNCGRIVPESWLFGAIQTSTRQFIIKSIDSRCLEDIQNIILETIKEDSEVHSDKLSSYMSFFNNYNNNNYIHFTVDHSKNFKDSITGVNTNLIENLWGRLKRFLRQSYYKDKNYLQEYINEYCFRFKTKFWSSAQIFETLIYYCKDLRLD